MATNKRQVLIRVQPDTYAKLKVISDKNHRSVSNQLEWLMLQYIADYEAQNGKVSTGDTVSNNIARKSGGGTNILTDVNNNYGVVGGNFNSEVTIG